MNQGEPISYQALARGTPVLTSSGTEFGQVHHVLQIPDLDLFDGISVETKHGLRFVDRDQIVAITTAAVRCSLSDPEAEALPPPGGPAAVEPDIGHEEDQSFTAKLGRLFGRPHWKNVDD